LLNLRATEAPVPGPTPAIMAMSLEGMVAVGLVDVGNGGWGEGLMWLCFGCEDGLVVERKRGATANTTVFLISYYCPRYCGLCLVNYAVVILKSACITCGDGESARCVMINKHPSLTCMYTMLTHIRT
jgi:hypothetical protein